jgi:hypothetical protein
MLEDEAETAEESALPGWHVHVPTFRLTHLQFAVCTYYAVCMDPMGLPKTFSAIPEACLEHVVDSAVNGSSQMHIHVMNAANRGKRKCTGRESERSAWLRAHYVLQFAVLGVPYRAGVFVFKATWRSCGCAGHSQPSDWTHIRASWEPAEAAADRREALGLRNCAM